MYVYRARGHEASIAPNRIENLIAAEDAPLVSHEIFDQANLSSGCIHLFPPHRQDKALGVDFDLSRCNPGCSLRGVRTADYGVDPRHEFTRAHWLDHKIVGPRIEPSYAVLL